MNEKLKEKSNDFPLCKSNCVFNHGETDSYLEKNEEVINCSINFVFHPEIKGKKLNCYFNLEELMNILEEEIQSVSGKYSSNVDIEEFYNAEQEGLESLKKHPPEILYSIKSSDLEKEFQPVEIMSPRKEVLQKIIDMLKNSPGMSNSKTNKRQSLIDERKFRGFTLDLMDEKNEKYEEVLSEKTILYFKIRAIYHERTLREEIACFLNEIGKKDYEQLTDILL
ncbi:hypothetical protein DSAG12_04375 [Promethearchaeum syntrophicum]|uniref:Uncharacterized protein n=1 Tax=Promethearchaeum syntrophicum TaxID=2594042 RepID=A0AC61ZU21_9ARCH